MTARRLLSFAAFILLGTLTWATETGQVIDVVDGDTLKVDLGDRIETVRLIGVDTPEVVHSNKPVEHFGKEASGFARRVSLGQLVRLEDDPQGNNRDKYGRLLRYVFLPDGGMLNAEIISQGFGYAYTRFPFTRMEEFRALEREARESNRGLWGNSSEDPVADAGARPVPAHDPADANDTVYITRTGTKYHRSGCRYLAKSVIPIALGEAATTYGPCSVCTPPRPRTIETAQAKPTGPGDGTTPTPKAAPTSDVEEAETVYTTRTGTKYHRAGCRYLAKSQVPLPLREAVARYKPCSFCRPPTRATATPPSSTE